MEELERLYEAILDGDAKAAQSVTEKAVAAGASPQTLLDDFMIPAMDEAGRLFEDGEYFVPELLVSARAMKSSLAVLRPLLAERNAKPAASRGHLVAVATVKGDMHDIGKNLVSAMLEGGGFEIVDLGVDVGPQQVVAAVQNQGVNIVALSALLTTTMSSMQLILDALVAANVRDRVKVIVGGAAVTEEYARQIGADGYSDNASGAVALARTLIGAA